MRELTFFLGLQVKQKKDGIFISQDKYVAKILRKFRLTDGKLASTLIDTEKPLLKDLDGEDVDVYIYRSMIGSLMYLTSSRPYIMFAVCLCARLQVTPKASHLHAVKRIFRYLRGKPHLGLWYPKDSPSDLVAYSDSDYAGASLDRKSTTGGCQFLGCRLISWHCKKQTVVATLSTEAEYVAAASCCAQVLWIQNQLLDYGSIKYALTVNPNIYVSCIKQFWTTVVVKKVNDVTRMQALVEKKKVVITEVTIRDALRLDDAEGVECLPNEEIFAELARMGYEKPSTKLTFYKAFFSSQWKFLIHAILLVRNVDRSYKILHVSSFGNLLTHTTKYTFPALTQKVFANMRRVGKGFSGVETPLFEGMLVAQEVGEGVADEVHDEGVHAAGIATKGDVSAAHDEVPTADEELSIPSPTPPTPPQPYQDIPSTSQIAQALEITKLKRRVKKLERRNKVKVLKLRRLQKVGTGQRIETSDDTVMDDVSNQGRMIAEMDADADVVLEEAKEVAADAKADQDAKVDESVDNQGRQAESQAEIYKIDLDHANKLITEVVTAASITITATGVPVPATTTAAAPKDKEDPVVKRYQALKRKPQTEAQARKNMMIYLKNVAGFKMDYFKGMSYDDIRPIFEAKALKRIIETPAEKAAKRKKLDDEIEELKRHLQIVTNEEDDVYTEATPLDRKVLVVDYEIINQNNKPYYKIIRADGTHQLYMSFLSLLRNFDREDLEVLWSLVNERFATTKPKNLSDDFLLITLGAMFEKPDIHA
uniref:Uncharacterized mitochondrial protein AtMg00810-like n=1 Tax=Tanacetum cinerariifolium TaxID=118510 RepID=A0A6L2KBT0_TANCI|nr:uncharacterized mitochondrial protein AtMg00810-like [Tanacetum cinerariifolium]